MKKNNTILVTSAIFDVSFDTHLHKLQVFFLDSRRYWK